MDGIYSATQSQNEALTEISHAMNNLDEITQYNSELVDKNSEAIARTNTQVAELDDVAAKFKLSQKLREAA